MQAVRSEVKAARDQVLPSAAKAGRQGLVA